MAEWHSDFDPDEMSNPDPKINMVPEEPWDTALFDSYVSDDPYWKQDVFEDIWDEPSEDEENDEADREANQNQHDAGFDIY